MRIKSLEVENFKLFIEKFNEILGTSSGKNSLLKDLGIVIGEVCYAI